MKNFLIFIVVIVILGGVSYASYPSQEKMVEKPASPPLATSSPVATEPVIPPKILPHIVVSSDQVIQGDPFLISLEGVTGAELKKITFQNRTLPVFIYKNKPTAIVGIDLAAKTGVYPVIAQITGTTTLTHNISIVLRKKIEAPLGIPEKLGGNTKEGEKTLVQALNIEAETLRKIVSTSTRLWKEDFGYPIKNIFITDDYGYSRQTVSVSIAHKGTDFRAKEGTEVFAMNDGVVLLAREFTAYGKLIALDHGQGIVTLYLHLSNMKVKEGDRVVKGELIGLSGQTGYAEGAHLHISVRVHNLSIDPIVFMKLLGVER